MRKYVITNRY